MNPIIYAIHDTAAQLATLFAQLATPARYDDSSGSGFGGFSGTDAPDRDYWRNKTPYGSQPSSHMDMSPEKARKILHDGTAQGHPLTEKQRGLFGAIAGREDNARYLFEGDEYNAHATQHYDHLGPGGIPANIPHTAAQDAAAMGIGPYGPDADMDYCGMYTEAGYPGTAGADQPGLYHAYAGNGDFAADDIARDHGMVPALEYMTEQLARCAPPPPMAYGMGGYAPHIQSPDYGERLRADEMMAKWRMDHLLGQGGLGRPYPLQPGGGMGGGYNPGGGNPDAVGYATDASGREHKGAGPGGGQFTGSGGGGGGGGASGGKPAKKKREKGDFAITSIDGTQHWFSDWLDQVASELERTGAPRDGLTHWILVDSFKKHERPDYLVSKLMRPD